MNRKILWITVVLLLACGINAEQLNGKNLVVVLEKGTDSFDFKNVYVEEGPASVFGTFGNYSGRILDFDNRELFAFSFEMDTKVFVEGKGFIETGASKELALPYFTDAAFVEISEKNGPMVLRIPVGFLGKTCGNNRCESSESFGDCPADCRSNALDNYCNPAKQDGCDLDCPAGLDSDCTATSFAFSGNAGLLSSEPFNAIANSEKNKQLDLGNAWFVGLVAIILLGLAWAGRKIQNERSQRTT